MNVKTTTKSDGTIVERSCGWDGVTRWARFSADRSRRYLLGRSWALARSLLFVMLNPSTAGALHDDQTIRRCVYFARRQGAGGILVINLFSYRATDPAELLEVDDPCDPANAWTLNTFLHPPIDTVVAWGAYDPRLGSAGRDLIDKYQAGGVPLFHLGALTASGQPRHPCRLRNDTPLIAYGEAS